MIQTKMKYGIDLGTTNSSICKLDKGVPVIVKIGTQDEIIPSCVSISPKQKVSVGGQARNVLSGNRKRRNKNSDGVYSEVYIEFKRTMGLDTQYPSKNLEKIFSSEELSAEVLKYLKSAVRDEEVKSAVITIPAKFKTDQIAATKRAATLAGITSCELLQEPIAASMAYGLSSENKNGVWLVFDFGGGTFDAALVKVEEGIMQIVDTEGDNYLGGTNLDYAIIDKIIIPYIANEYSISNILSDDTKRKIFRDAFKDEAEKVKNELSLSVIKDVYTEEGDLGLDDNEDEINLDFNITREQLKTVLSPIFQKAVDICKELLKRNNISKDKLDTLILVGGPTYSPILRDMLREQITPNVDTSIDPMTAVAQGAALYASGIDVISDKEIESGTAALEVSYESDSVETEEYVTIKLLPNSCKGSIPSKLFIECVRADKGWSSGKVEINDIGDVIECHLLEGKANSFSINGYDNEGNRISCYPDEFTIIQGSKVGSAVLPYNIGIEVHSSSVDKDVFTSVKGLEKNKSLPAVGVRNGLKMPKQIRPGVANDRLIIPIYQGEYAAEGSSAIHNDHVFDVVITGDDVPALIPADSDIDITIKVDRSQLLYLEVIFNAIGETIEKEINIGQRSAISAEELDKRITEAERKIFTLRNSSSIPQSETEQSEKMVNEVRSRYEGEKGQDDGRTNLLADLRRAYLKVEETEKKYEWESIGAELREEFRRLEKANNKLGNKYDAQIAELRNQTEQAIRSKDVKIGRAVLDNINSLFVQVTLIYQLVGVIRNCHQEFNSIPWKNATRARQLLNQGEEMINNNPTADGLRPICVAILELIDRPESEKLKIG